jgi:hypothetical protein
MDLAQTGLSGIRSHKKISEPRLRFSQLEVDYHNVQRKLRFAQCRLCVEPQAPVTCNTFRRVDCSISTCREGIE